MGRFEQGPSSYYFLNDWISQTVTIGLYPSSLIMLCMVVHASVIPVHPVMDWTGSPVGRVLARLKGLAFFLFLKQLWNSFRMIKVRDDREGKQPWIRKQSL